MKNKNMKKALSAAISAAMLLSSTVVTTWAEGNSITRVYADNYGLDVVFANDVVQSDYADLSFTDSNGNGISSDVVQDGNIIHVNFNSEIDSGKDYYLSVGNVYKQVTVNNLQTLDFESMPLTTGNANTTIWGTNWYSDQSVVTFITNNTALGADNKKLAITGSPFTYKSSVSYKDVTFSLDMRQFDVNTVAGGTPLAKNTLTRVALASNCAKYKDSYGMDVTENAASVGIHNQAGSGSYNLAAGYASMSTVDTNKAGEIYIESADPDVTTGTLTNQDLIDLNYTVKSVGTNHRYALRNYDNVVAGYRDNSFIGSVIDNDNLFPNNKYIMCESMSQCIALIDNLRVTSCTVTDFDVNNVEIDSVYADSFHTELRFQDDITGATVSGLDKLSLVNYATGEKVNVTADDCTISGKTISINLPLATNTKYILNISPGFGTMSTKTANSLKKTFIVTELYNQNFEDSSAQMLGNMFRTNDNAVNDSSTNLKIKDGKLWMYNNVIAPIAPGLATAENVTFSFDMDIYNALQKSQFQTGDAYNYKYSPYLDLSFNAKRSEVSSTNLAFESNALNTYYWKLNGKTDIQRGHTSGYYTVVTPADGSSYQAGDTYHYVSTSPVNPDAATVTIPNVGECSYGNLFGKVKHTTFVPGDAFYDSTTKAYTVIEKGAALPADYVTAINSAYTVSQRAAETVHTKIQKMGTTGYLYLNDILSDTYSTGDPEIKTGYFAVKSSQVEIVSFDNMKITEYNELATATEVELISADEATLMLKTPVAFGTINSFDNFTITNVKTGAVVVPTGTSYTGDVLYINAALEKNVPYKLSVLSGFCGAKAIFDGEYTKYFKINEVLNINGASETDLAKLGISPANDYKKIVGDHAELFSTNIETPKYKNATVTAKLKYFSLNDKGNNIYANSAIKKADSTTINAVSGTDTQSVYKGSLYFYQNSANNASSQLTVTNTAGDTIKYKEKVTYNETRPVGVYTKTTDTAGVATVAYTTDVDPYVVKYVMADDTYRIYKNNNVIFDINQTGLNNEGSVLIGGSGVNITWLYYLTVTQMESIDSLDLNVNSLSADANKIYVNFDDSIDGMTDFSKVSVTENGTSVAVNCTASENVLTIVPTNGIVSDAVYGVTVGSGFGPSEISLTNAEYSKKFSVTVYANENFDNQTFDTSALKIASSKADNGISYTNGGVAFYNAAAMIINPAFVNAENYNVKYDYKVYASLNTIADDASKNYDSTIPYSQIWFNAGTDSTTLPDLGYWWYVKYAGIEPRIRINQEDTILTAQNFTESKTEYGDGYFDSSDNSIVLFNNGDDFDSYTDDAVTDKNGDLVTTSSRSAKLYQYEIDKNGVGAQIKRDNAQIAEFTGDESASVTNTKGYFALNSQITEITWIDNLQAYTFNELSGIITSFDTDNNKILVENLDAETHNAVVIVCAYNGSEMIDAYIAPATDFAKGITEVGYTFESAGNATKYRAFVWDDLTNIKPCAAPTTFAITK